MRLVRALPLLALLLAPLVATATPGPMYFQKSYTWSGTTVGGVATDTFVVPPTAGVLCYVRWNVFDNAGFNDHVASFKLAMTDGGGRLAVLDGGATLHMRDQGIEKVIVPQQTVLWFSTFTPGTFTVRFQAEGFHGYWAIQVYRVDAVSECGTLPPP